MHTPQTYIASTESAVRKLFEGIESYTELLDPIRGISFVSDQNEPVKFQVEYDIWTKKNAATLNVSMAAQRAYTEQTFAMATLCGAVLQVAAKAIECYSINKTVPSSLQSIVGDSQSAKQFCIGREVRAVPIGLIIFAGRNQHTHFNELQLNRINVEVFECLAVLPEDATVYDSAFNLGNPLLQSYASNITFILGWRSYDAYVADLGSLLGIN